MPKFFFTTQHIGVGAMRTYTLSLPPPPYKCLKTLCFILVHSIYMKFDNPTPPPHPRHIDSIFSLVPSFSAVSVFTTFWFAGFHCHIVFRKGPWWLLPWGWFPGDQLSLALVCERKIGHKTPGSCFPSLRTFWKLLHWSMTSNPECGLFTQLWVNWSLHWTFFPKKVLIVYFLRFSRMSPMAFILNNNFTESTILGWQFNCPRQLLNSLFTLNVAKCVVGLIFFSLYMNCISTSKTK